jgi:prepilin-type N-terminal cleavage/methylation domain-containing protein/prepilin-type processing-associated H-X9-DG protein
LQRPDIGVTSADLFNIALILRVHAKYLGEQIFNTQYNLRMTQKKQTKKAFTLIELLVVISIITLLTGILLPALSSVREYARSTVCLANVRRLALAGVMYAQANGAFPPHRMKKRCFSDPYNFVNKYGRERPRWQWFFDQGVGPVIDPSPWVKKKGDIFTDDDTLMMTNDYFICPSFRHYEYSVYDIRNGSYGYNYQYLGNARDRPDLGKYQNFPVRESAIKMPSAIIIVGDGRGSKYPHGPHSYKLDPPKIALSTGAIYFGNWTQPTIEEQHCPAEARHNHKANVSFLDAHAKSMTLEELGYVVDENGFVITNHPGGNNRLFTGTGQDDSGYNK